MLIKPPVEPMEISKHSADYALAFVLAGSMAFVLAVVMVALP